MVPFCALKCLCTLHFYASLTQLWLEVPSLQHCVCRFCTAIAVFRMAIERHLYEKRLDPLMLVLLIQC